MSGGLPPFELERFLPYRLTVIAAELSTALSRRYRTEFGISVAEWRILLNLGYSGSGSVRDIERRVSLEKSKVSRSVSRLEGKGLVTKSVDPDDRRLLHLGLTEAGFDLLGRLIPIAQDYEDELKGRLGEALEPLHASLDRLAEGRD